MSKNKTGDKVIRAAQAAVEELQVWALELYKRMLTAFYLEEHMKIFVRQGKCSLHASTRGHECLQVGMALLLEPRRDWFFTYYRSKALAVGLGMPLGEIFLAMLSREGDPNSNGRNMAKQFSSRDLHVVAQTACTGTQYLPAVGMARTVKMDGGDQIVYVSSGEGATSEGEFFEALNLAAREDAKGLIKTAARAEDPVLFLEHKGLYRRPQAKTQEPDAEYLVPFGRGRIRKEGRDLTIVTWGSTVYMALEAARQLESGGHSIEVIDLRSIVPLDEEIIYTSVQKTSRVVITHEDSLFMGFGAEVAARVAQNCFTFLDAPVTRVAAKDSFVPAATVEDARRTIEEVLRY